MNEEIKDSEHESNNQMYKDAVERYKAVKMDESIVEAYYSCVKLKIILNKQIPTTFKTLFTISRVFFYCKHNI